MAGQRRRNLASQRQRLFDQQAGLCFWCHKPMRIVDVGKGISQPADSATFDHIYPRNDERRSLRHGGRQPRVLSCLTCNRERGNAPVEAFAASRQQSRTGEET